MHFVVISEHIDIVGHGTSETMDVQWIKHQTKNYAFRYAANQMVTFRGFITDISDMLLVNKDCFILTKKQVSNSVQRDRKI